MLLYCCTNSLPASKAGALSAQTVGIEAQYLKGFFSWLPLEKFLRALKGIQPRNSLYASHIQALPKNSFKIKDELVKWDQHPS